jgi:hypothetical protein
MPTRPCGVREVVAPASKKLMASRDSRVRCGESSGGGEAIHPDVRVAVVQQVQTREAVPPQVVHVDLRRRRRMTGWWQR